MLLFLSGFGENWIKLYKLISNIRLKSKFKGPDLTQRGLNGSAVVIDHERGE